MELSDGVFQPTSDSDVDLGTTGVRWKDAFIDNITVTNDITRSGNISGSSSSTGSFGRIDASARIYESGTSVIDHATAMAIVFGG